MRQFEVYIDRGVPGESPVTETFELPDNATEKQIDDECARCLEDLIANNFDCGWREIGPKPANKKRATGGTK